MKDIVVAIEGTAPRVSDRHLPGLDGLRGIACLLVFIYHLRWAAGDPPLTIGSLDFVGVMRNCDIGVAIFFALSGLLLSVPFWRAMDGFSPRPHFGPYMWRRVCRIVPAYYTCLLVIYLLQGGTYTFYGFLDFLLHVTFLHPFSDESYLSHHGVLWTIGIEFQFYLLLPFLMLGMRAMVKRVGAVIACVVLIAGSFLVGLAAKAALIALEPMIADRFLGPEGKVIQMGTIFHYLKYFAFGIAGGALALHWRRLGSARVPSIAAGLAAAAVFALLLGSSEGIWREVAVTGWPLNMAAFALLAAALPSAPVLWRFLELRPLVFAGEISYGVYLWHDLVLKAVFAGTLPGRLAGWPLVMVGGLVALGVTTLIAWLSYRVIEQPPMRASYPFVTARRS